MATRQAFIAATLVDCAAVRPRQWRCPATPLTLWIVALLNVVNIRGASDGG